MANPDINSTEVNLVPTLRTSHGLNPALKSAATAVTEAHDPTREVSYFVKRSGLYMAGKGTAEAVGETIAESSAHSSFLGLSTMLGSSAAGLVTVGLAAGVSATLVQMDYVHRKDNIKDMYKEELASRLHKPLGKVIPDDLDTLSKENKVIAEELNQIRKQRTFGVGLSFIASMAALSVVVLALPAIVAAVTGAATGAAAMAGLGTVGALALKAVVGLATYHAVKDPLHHIADKAFHLDYTTTHDHIVSLKRDREAGRAITREQVLSVYAAANPMLDHMIAREYGKKFDNLSPDQKSLAAAELSKLIPMDTLINDINSGKVNVTELAFAVEGQISGVQNGRPVEEEKKGLVNALMKGIQNTFRPKTTAVAVDTSHEHIAAIAKAESNKVHIPPQPEANRVSHVQLTGRDRKMAMAHVERLDQQRAEQQLANNNPQLT